MSGWISLDRAITKHWLWQNEKFTKGQAWIDLLLHAAHTPNKKLIKGTLIPVSRGEQIRSQLTLAKAWSWDRKTVSRFLKLLEKDGMIVSRVDHLTSYVSICNYDSFQNNSGDDTQHKGHLKGQQEPTREDTNNKVNKDNNDNNNNTATSRFDEFWNLYDKKTSRSKCEPKFNKLKESDVEKIFNALPSYIKSTPDVKYRKNPLTWLNGKCWNDVNNQPEQLINYIDVIEIFNSSMSNHKEVPIALDTTPSRIRMINKLVELRGMTIDGFKSYFDHISNNNDLQYFLNGLKMPARGIDHFLKDDTFMNIKESKGRS